MTWTTPFPDERFNLLGIDIDRLSRSQLLAAFESALDSSGPIHIAYINVAVSNQASGDPDLASILNSADLVYVDGAGIQLGCRLLGASCPPRNTGADFLGEIFGLCARKGKSVGLLGGTPGAAEKIRKIYTCHYPQLMIKFVCDGFEEFEQSAVWEPALLSQPPDLLLVGMGVPRQERWIRDYGRRFDVRVYWSVGALFEYDSGHLKRCPDWMGRWGLEWLFRLVVEPKRLWQRYLIGNPRFLRRCLSSRWRGRAETL